MCRFQGMWRGANLPMFERVSLEMAYSIVCDHASVKACFVLCLLVCAAEWLLLILRLLLSPHISILLALRAALVGLNGCGRAHAHACDCCDVMRQRGLAPPFPPRLRASAFSAASRPSGASKTVRASLPTTPTSYRCLQTARTPAAPPLGASSSRGPSGRAPTRARAAARAPPAAASTARTPAAGRRGDQARRVRSRRAVGPASSGKQSSCS
eukprot:6209422-Pleurochrysis_carterae.AAC.6